MIYEVCALRKTVTELLLLMIKFKYCVIIFKTCVVYYGLLVTTSHSRGQKEKWRLGFCVRSVYLCIIDLFLVYIHKAIPLQAWTGPEGSRKLRLPDFKTVGT